MNRPIRYLLAAGLLLGAATRVSLAGETAAARKVREPAVAGLFYPKDPAELARMIDQFLAAARTPPAAPGRLRALICPHAGYVYSGPVAASGFRLLQGASFATVFVLAPSHYALLPGASVADADVFRTPLGDVPLAEAARRLARLSPYALEPQVSVQRPEWAGQSSRARPATEAETAETWEHADEVEVPWLQRTLGRFQLVPVLFGELDPTVAARRLQPFITEDSLIVVSSDLSHYHPYDEARALDHECISAICALDSGKMARQEACGRMPILTLIHLARALGWEPRLLDYRNSGDTAGDKSRVVGYAAIAFYAPAAPAGGLTAAQQRYLLELAHRTVREVTATGRLPAVDGAGLDARLTAPRGCFVTLTEDGRLRGCIGHLQPMMPLYQAVIDNARNAAPRDPRFPPVAADEAGRLKVEISVLTVPEPLPFSSPDDLLRQLRPRVDGVILDLNGRSATYLPQVWDELPSKVGFLNSLAEKAGGDAADWRGPGVSVSIYHVEAFKDSDR